MREWMRALRQFFFLRSSQWWSPDRIIRYQAEQLVRTMRFAVSEVPFYRALGISPDSIRSAADLSRFPVITKRTVQEQGDRLLADGLDKTRLHASRTSGSTGEPTTTYFDMDCWLLTKYTLKLRRTLAAVSPVMKRTVVVSEAAQVEPGRKRFRAQVMHVAHLSIHDDPKDQILFLQRHRPHIIYAFPSFLLEVLHTCRELGLAVPRVPIVFTSSEVLSEQTRRTIQDGFQAQIFDIYGSTEFKEIAWQCRYGRYHLNFESVHVEPGNISTDANSATHPLLVSSLHNYAMPLLRFELGDLATLSEPKSCPCGRSSPYLNNIEGRQTTYIRLPSGRRISPYLLTTAVEHHSAIKKYRIVQTATGALRLDYVPFQDSKRGVDSSALSAELSRILDEPVQLTLNPLMSIPRSSGGKHHVVQIEGC